MAQTKIYPSTQAQVQAVQNTVDEINAKIVTPKYQAKIVDPTTSQQLIQPDAGYDALSSVTVNASTVGRTLENYVMRNNQEDLFDLNLNGNIPSYACYRQSYLRNVVGNIGNIDDYAFQGCVSLQSIDLRNATIIGSSAFISCNSLQSIDARNVATTKTYAFAYCSSLQFIDLRSTAVFDDYLLFSCSDVKVINLTNKQTPPKMVGPAYRTLPSSSYYIVVVDDDTAKTNFQSATNWSDAASHIKTIAEVEAEVGMTYDEYYLQCFGHARNEVQA